jgi:hypothetical protein
MVIVCAAVLLSAPAVSAATAHEMARATARPNVELVAQHEDAVTLRFTADEDSRFGARSVFVQVPDRGRIEVELGNVPGMDASRLVEVSEPAIMRDIRVVSVQFVPSPDGAEGGDFARELAVTIRTTAEPGANEKTRTDRPLSRAFHNLYRGEVINYDAEAAEAALAAQARDGRDPLPNGAAYLCISVDSFADEIAPLVEWKNAKGIQARTYTLSQTGYSEPEIRAFIQNAYDTWEVPPEYVLLVGDSENLPGYESLTYTDNYYTTMEGGDWLADIMLGRISADYGSHVSTQVAKILAYEKTPMVGDPDWPLTGSLWVHDDFDDGDWIYYLNTFRVYDQMHDAGFSPIDTLFHRNDIERSDVYASVNQGKGFINFRGQAWINWLDPFNLNISNVENDWRLPIVVSATCGTGNYEYDGFVCEEWQREGNATSPDGSVAFFATNTAFPGSEELSLRRGYVDEGFFDNVFETGSGALGEACIAGRMRMYTKDANQVDYEGWNLLGDPEMQIWTAAPFQLNALHDGGTQIGSSDFTVTVLSGGSLYEGARVALAKGNEVLVTGTSDASGQVTLPISPTTTGTMTVTVTDRNAAPYHAEVLVLDSGPFVVYSDVAIEDAADGNDDGQMNTGETTEIDVQLANIGDVMADNVTARFRSSDPNITIVDSLATYGDMPAATTHWGSDTFELTVDPGVPNGTLVPYSVVVFIDGVESAVLNPSPLQVVTAVLAHSATVIDDSGAGGNGDGSAGAGETVGLTLTLSNDGLSSLEDVTGTLTCSDPRIAITNATAPFHSAPVGGICENTEVAFLLSISPTATSGHVVPLSLQVTGDGYSYTYDETIEFEIVTLGASIAAPLGPDAYGYYAYDMADSAYGPAPGYDWFDIAPPGPGNIITAITDEDAGVTTMGSFFDIWYYGAPYDLITVNSNGFLSPGTTDYRFGDNSPIPDTHGPPNMIAPFWDDLDPSAGGDVYTWMDIANHLRIFQFEEVPIYGTSNTQTFQVIIYDEEYYPTPTGDCQIKFQYENVTFPYGCTVGIENLYQTDGIQWLYNSTYSPHAAPVENGSAILFTTVVPSDPDVTWLVLTDSSVDDSAGGNGDGLLQMGETIELQVEFSSQGGTSAEDVSVVLTSGEPMLAVVDGTADVPNIPAGGSRWSSDPLTFTITESLTDTVATLWAQVTANGGAYVGSGRVDVRLDFSDTGADEVASVFSLRPGRPNPFEGTTRLQLTLPSPEKVTARVYNAAGRVVRTLVDSRMTAGEHFLPWDGTNDGGDRVASGVYFVKLSAGANNASQKVVLLR